MLNCQSSAMMANRKIYDFEAKIDISITFDSQHMFPNDDICSIEAAKDAAKRLFRRYKSRGNQQPSQGSLGKNEINKLITATYQAINMSYQPDQEDVFSFMSVFGQDQQGKISLENLESIAVKYLCGENMLNNHEQVNQNQILQKESRKLEQNVNQQQHLHSIQTYESNPQIKTLASSKDITMKRIHSNKGIQSKKTLIESNSQRKFEDKEETDQKRQININKTRLDQAKDIFNTYKNISINGITNNEAGIVIHETYKLFGKKHFEPTQDDIAIWMKLCDRNKDGVVSCQDYEYFILKTIERQARNVL